MEGRKANHVISASAVVCFILIATLAFVFGLHFIWLSQHEIEPTYDTAGHLTTSIECWYLLKYQPNQLIHGLFSLGTVHPPLLPLCMAGAYMIAGNLHPKTALLVNVLFIVILATVVYALGSQLFGRRAGVLSAMLIVTFPALFGSMKQHRHEVLLSTFVIALTWALWNSQGFTVRRWSMIAGVIMAGGLFCKITFPVYALGALISVFLITCMQIEVPWKRRLMNVGWFIATSAIGLSWYIVCMENVLDKLAFSKRWAQTWGVLLAPAPHPWLRYLCDLPAREIMLIPFCLFLYGMFSLLRINDRVKGCFLPCAFISSYALLNLHPFDKTTSHFIPMLPWVALIAGGGINRLRSWQWYAITIPTVLLSFAGLITTTFAPANWGIGVRTKWIECYLIRGPHDSIGMGPPPHMHAERVVRHIVKLQREYSRFIKIGVLPNYPGYETLAIQYHAVRHWAHNLPNMPVYFDRVMRPPRGSIEPLLAYDALVGKTGIQGSNTAVQWMEYIKRHKFEFQSHFELYATWKLGDGSNALIWRRKQEMHREFGRR
ncbi:MAG TPA: hypothetical protein EYP10_08930 [Armatimonadetes bacterium]|nr:hypothetical protein [Armatimonadota bacterium]